MKVDDVLTCIHPGVVSITNGDEAYSADAVVNNTFTVTDVTRNSFWVFGKLNIKDAGFVRDPGLSGKDPEQLKKIPIKFSGVEFAIMRENIDTKIEDDFWSCWKTK